jgi:hypothetical protein
MAIDHLGAPRARSSARGFSTPYLSRRRRVIFGFGVALLAALLACKLAVGPTSAEWVRFLREDGPVEGPQPVMLWIASAAALGGALRLMRRRESTLALVYALLGLFFFFVGGEEMSWGQRIFGVASPEFFQENNRQGEISVHNLGPVQVLLDYAYLALGTAGTFGWMFVPRLGRVLLDPARQARTRRVVRLLLGAAVPAGLAAALAGALLTPERAVALGILHADVAPEDFQRHLSHLHDYRLAAIGVGVLLASAAALALARYDRVWTYLTTKFDLADRMLVPRWHLSVYFLPAFLYYAIHILLPHEIDAAGGLWNFLIQRDEQAVQALLYSGWLIFFYLRFHYIGEMRRRRRPQARVATLR